MSEPRDRDRMATLNPGPGLLLLPTVISPETLREGGKGRGPEGEDVGGGTDVRLKRPSSPFSYTDLIDLYTWNQGPVHGTHPRLKKRSLQPALKWICRTRGLLVSGLDYGATVTVVLQ